MAEFNRGGFSAVAAFFGEDSVKPESQNNNDKPTRQPLGGNRNRLGLGAKRKRLGHSGETYPKGNWEGNAEKLLRIGKKRQVDDSHDIEDTGTDTNDEFDDEEEEGRTSAVKKKKIKSKFVTHDLGNMPAKEGGKGKKKAGKKERFAATAIKSRKPASDFSLEERTEHNHEELHQDGGKHSNIDGNASASATVTKKRKRIKIRSRQKNIRKDNRKGFDKPTHLILGHPNFAARPLTAETRKCLNLLTSKTSRMRDRSHHGEKPERGEGACDGMGFHLAVDGLIDIGTPADQRDTHKVKSVVTHAMDPQGGIRKRRKEKKTRKTKYKNLR